MTMHKY